MEVDWETNCRGEETQRDGIRGTGESSRIEALKFLMPKKRLEKSKMNGVIPCLLKSERLR